MKTKLLLFLLTLLSVTGYSQTTLNGNIYGVKPLITVSDTTTVQLQARRESDGRFVSVPWNVFGGGGGNFIPLTGTTEGNPVEGNIEFTSGYKPFNYTLGTHTFSAKGEAGEGYVMYSTPTTYSTVAMTPNAATLSHSDFISSSITSGVAVDNSGVAIYNNSPTSRGLTSIYDYTPNITALDFTQKKYVDDAISAGAQDLQSVTDVDFITNNPILSSSNLQGNSITVKTATFNGNILSNNLTALRDLEMPDESGTIALEENQTLQSIADNGNTTTNTITTFGYKVSSDGVNEYYIADETGIVNTFGNIQFRTADGNSVLGVPELGTVNSWQLPNAPGTIPISVNGNTADVNGNITISAGSGTVTSVTGTSGVTVATGTTTPVIGLGNITPTSVAASGNVIGSNLSGTNSGDNVQATETTAGIAELATQTETNTGTDDLRIVTPLKLKTFGDSAYEAKFTAGANGFAYYTAGVRSWVTGGSNLYVTAAGTTSNFVSGVRGASIGAMTSSAAVITSTTTVADAAAQLQNQITAMTAYVSKTAGYTITASDYCIDLTANSATFTLPTAVGVTGKQYVIKNSGSGTTLTLATTSSQTIDGTTTKTFNTQYAGIRVISDGANWKIIGTY